MTRFLSIIAALGLGVLAILQGARGWRDFGPAFRENDKVASVNPAAIPGATLGVPGAVAALLFLRATTQLGSWYGRYSYSDDRYDVWADQLLAVAQLDPQLTQVPEMAAAVLGYQAGKVTQAHEILLHAVYGQSGRWQVFFWLGSLYERYYGNPEKAADWWTFAAMYPGAPWYLGNLAQLIRLSRGDRVDQQLEELYADTMQDTFPEIAEEWQAIRQFERQRRQWMSGLRRYYHRFGAWPTDLQQVVDAGIWTQIPQDPWGGEVRLGEDGRSLLPSEKIPLFLKTRDIHMEPDPELERGHISRY